MFSKKRFFQIAAFPILVVICFLGFARAKGTVLEKWQVLSILAYIPLVAMASIVRKRVAEKVALVDTQLIIEYLLLLFGIAFWFKAYAE